MVEPDSCVIVEFYGIPRQRAGRAELPVPPGSVADVLAAVERHCPGLAGMQRPDGLAAGPYLLSINGEPFVADPTLWLRPGDRLLVLSADAGG